MITVTPSSAKSVIILGKASDFATCEAVKRTGEACGSFVDGRTRSARRGNDWTPICPYHVAAAMDKSKTQRPEFSGSSRFAGTDDGKKSKKKGNKRKFEKDADGQWQRSGPSAVKYMDVAEDGPSGSGAGHRYTVGGRPKAEKVDQSDILFDVTAEFGRNKSDREQLLQKRKREETVIATLDQPKPRRSIETNAKLKAIKLQGSTEPENKHLWKSQGGRASSAALLMQKAEQALKEQREKAEKAKKGRNVRDDRTMAQDSDGSSDETEQRPGGNVVQQRWRHSSSAVKAMGFNPLLENSRDGKEEERVGESRGTLLARNSKFADPAPDVRLSSKGTSKWRNVRPPEGASLTSAQRAYAETYGVDLDDMLSDYDLSD